MSPVKHLQTRLHLGYDNPADRGNCLPTVLSCIMELNSPEEAYQVQEDYDKEDYMTTLLDWLLSKGWELTTIQGHLYDDSYYFVSGYTNRDTFHICIYQNGQLWHDPHPSGSGLITEDNFQILERI